MEETAWIAVGIISVLLVFGILAGFFKNSIAGEKMEYAKESSQLLGSMCNKVCLMPDQTKLYVNVNLPSGSVLNSSNERICMIIQSESYCSRCKCAIDDYSFDLDNEEAKNLFNVHLYKCFFLKNSQRISMECLG